MKKVVCFETEIGGFKIILEQTGKDLFTVTYGLQVKKGLPYSAAAEELGYCIMHASACEGKLENAE